MTTSEQERPRRFIFVGAIGLIALAASLPVVAQTVVFDQGPTSGSNGGWWLNETTNQNFADQATLANGAQVTAMSIFTGNSANVATVHIKILADNAGVPGSVIYSEDKAPDSWVADAPSGGYKVRVVLTTPFTANPGVTYWYGMSGNGVSMGQDSVVAPGDGHMAQFYGATYTNATDVGDQMFQLEGLPFQSIPTIGMWGLLAFTLALLAAGLAVIRRLA